MKLANLIVLDVGSSKIAAIAANLNKNGKIDLITQILHYSGGMRSGIVTDIVAAEESIVGTIYALEKECNKNIKEIMLVTSGAGAKSYYIDYSIEFGDIHTISHVDVKKLLQKALEHFTIMDKEIIHYFPLRFTIDNDHIVDNPIGVQGKKLSCNVHIVAVNHSSIANLTQCFARCNVEVTKIGLSVYTAGVASLTDDEKSLGSVLIEFGSHTTNIAVFYEGEMIYTGYVSIGGAHITADIAKTCSVSIETAEKLKILYGVASIETLQNDSMVNVEDFEPENNYDNNLTISVSQIAKIIEPRLQEILEKLKKQIDVLEMDNILSKRVVVTGGGASMQGLRTVVSKLFNKQVRVAKFDTVLRNHEGHSPHSYAATIGMVKYYADIVSRNTEGYYNLQEKSGWFKKAMIWVKDNM
jgi:cell division protein FtsA